MKGLEYYSSRSCLPLSAFEIEMVNYRNKFLSKNKLEKANNLIV